MLISLSSAMAGVLELEPAAVPATVLESEGTGRERRARGFYFGDSGHGKRRSAPAAWQPWPRLMSLLVAGRGRGAGWGRPRVLWRCSAAAYLGVGCLQEEIDERLLRLGRESRESSIQGGREAVSGGAGAARRVEGGDGGQLGLAFYRPKKQQQLAASTTAINGGDYGRASGCGRR